MLGANGQDGSYLCEHMLSRGWDVHGVGRQPETRFVPISSRFHYHPLDLHADSGALSELLLSIRPVRVYHVAAIHGASGFVYEDRWQAALQVNTGSVHQCLEFIRKERPETRLLYASSVKAFDSQPPAVVHEELTRRSTCLYSITKNATGDLISYYRKYHGVRATSLYLFNHESPRRPAHYFLPRVTAMLARALVATGKVKTCTALPNAVTEPLRSLDFACDWGSSKEYMALGAELLERDPNQDYVMATGKTWTGAEFVSELFGVAGLDWREHLDVLKPPGSEAIHMFRADIARMKAVLGYGPQKTAIDVAKWILSENHGVADLDV